MTAVAPALVVDLTQEEDEGGLGGPIVWWTPFQRGSPSLLALDGEALDVIEALGRNWEFLGSIEATTSGDYTPTGLCESPEL